MIRNRNQIKNLQPLKFLLSSSQVGDKLRQLETSWVGLVSKNYEIEQVRKEIRLFFLPILDPSFSQAIMNMEQEYSYLKAQHQTRGAE